MRIRTRSYAVAFAASAGVASISMQQPEALRSTMSPLQLSTPKGRSESCQTRNTNRSNNRLYSARIDADTETVGDTMYQRKSYGAPVVDSTLLRFISQQKMIPDVFRETSVVIEETSSSSSSSSLDVKQQTELSSAGTMFQPTIQSTTKMIENDSDEEYDTTTDVIKQKLTGGAPLVEDTQDEVDFVYANTLANTDPSASNSDQSWMAQFGSNNVAQLLLESGDITDESLAKTAGDAVERYCVVRTARMRIRRFLKERDTLWQSASDGSSSSRSELESLAASDMATSPAASLLLSYAEQREKQQRSAVSSETEDEGDDFDDEATPSYDFEDVLAVMRDYGLTGNDLCVLLTHSPNLALRVPSKSFLREGQMDEAETLEETLERSLKGLLMSTLGLRRYDARKVLRTCPGLLSVRGSESAVQVVTIMTKLGVSHKSLVRDKNSLPVLLSRSPAGLFRLVAFLSSTAIRMPLEQIGPLLRRRVGRELMDALLPVPNTSYSKVTANANANTNDEEEVETTLEDDAAAWSRTRIERQERIERTYALMTKTAMILKAQIGTEDLSKVVAAYPQVLLLDAEKNILPVARYMMGGLGIWQNDLSGVLQLYPTLLGTKIDDLERVVSYVLTLGVDEDDLAGIFRAFPGLFAMKVEDMEAVVSYLESVGIRDIGAFVTKLPPVLGYSIEKDLKPKWEFLKTVCLQPEFEVEVFPAYFSYPLDRVIKARFNYLAYKGISIRFVSMRIDTVLRFGDVDFATKVALDDDDGEAFRLFGSQRGSTSANGVAAQKAKKKKRNNTNRNHARRDQNEAKAALAAAQRLSEDIDNAKDLAEVNRIFREAAPLRNRSLGNSLPSLKPSRPKRKQKRKQKEHPYQNKNQNQQQNNAQQQQRKQQKQQVKNIIPNRIPNQGRGDEGAFPCPA